MKKAILKGASVVLLTGSLFTYQADPAAAEDDLSGHSLEEEMRDAIDRGFLRGMGENYYAPDLDVTRAQFATFFARALDLPRGGSSEFEDVEDHQLLAGIERAAEAGLVGGYPDGTFRPDDNISRQEMAAMVERVLNNEGLSVDAEEALFADADDIHPDFQGAVAASAHYGIILGAPTASGEFRFSPRDDATRAQAAAFIERMLTVIEEDGEPLIDYRVASINEEGEVQFQPQDLATFDQAVQQAEQSGDPIVFYGQEIVRMDEGVVYANNPDSAITYVYENEGLTDRLTYITNGMEMDYVDAGEDWVQVEVAGSVGFVDQEEVELVPTEMAESRSHYTIGSGMLYHHIYSRSLEEPADPIAQGQYAFDDAPAFMEEGVEYRSSNGRDFYTPEGEFAGQHYSYFNYLPASSTTNYTAEDLDSYIEHLMATHSRFDNIDSSQMEDLGEAFLEAEEDHGINAFLLFGIALSESALGTSEIANDHNNLFGLDAIDDGAYDGASQFDEPADSVDAAGERLSQQYIDPEGWSARGSFLGTKSGGMNVYYASDPHWGQKIAGHMYRADQVLGGEDLHSYDLGVSNTAGLNVRSEPTTVNNEPLYELEQENHSVAILDAVEGEGGAIWYEIYSDQLGEETAYVHSSYIDRINN
ncbi:S-layer homology domain-containing protein [Salsuginibacillus kocurii]|uniref:S-layer homology domain-containing protein n=1 Tax=Salsuginibacillus kocurii TaxID=427078 RepID=UPI0003651B40|nr:S-layer homology domain-containing protein [Salsuginibacillus kocurii]